MLAGRLAETLRFAGHEVTVFARLNEALARRAGPRFELLAAPAGALARHVPTHEVPALRADGTLVLALAALADREHLAGLPADDYVLEPCNAEELAVRIDVLARRAQALPAAMHVAAPPYELRADTREVRLHGQPVQLTTREFELALFLFQRLGRKVHRHEIVGEIWGQALRADSRTLDAHVSSLRRKLALDAANGYRLCAHYGHGYSLTPVS